MSGSMSREWKRTVWQAPQARRTAPRHFLTLPFQDILKKTGPIHFPKGGRSEGLRAPKAPFAPSPRQIFSMPSIRIAKF